MKYAKRYLSLILTFALALSIPFAFTQEASAASKTKTQYVCVSNESSFTDPGGKTTKDKTEFTINKYGLMTSVNYGRGKTKYTRNKRGDVIKTKFYNKKGKLESTYTYAYRYNKKGLPVSEKRYIVRGGKKTLLSSATMTYYSNGKLKKSIQKQDRDKWVYEYKKNGIQKSAVINYDGDTDTYTFDKHGYPKKEVYKDKAGVTIETRAYTNKYDKYGNLKSSVCESTLTDEGVTTTSKTTTNIKNTYDSHKNVIKSVETNKEYVSGKHISTTKNVTTFKYKKVSVPKKYWRFFVVRHLQ